MAISPGDFAGLLGVSVACFTVVSFTPIGRAIARRVSGASDPAAAHDAQLLRDEVEQLRIEVDAMRGRMAEMDELQGRMDFAERMIAANKDRNALPGAR